MNATNGPGHFDERRQKLHAISAQLELLSQLVCRDRPDAHARLVRAQAMLEESAVTLCVAGGEGAGKSTLIDAILGSEVVPTEEAEPGTVAPVLVHWHDADTPAYSVLLQGAEAPVPCADMAQFRRFTLQALNPENRSGLVGGLVGLRHPLLADGLRLIDMPGAEGGVEGIKEDTLAALREAHAVLFVIRDRIFATVKRLVAELTVHGVAIQGVVSNQDARLWRKTPRGLVTEVQEVLRRHLAEAGAQLPTERIFVLHLPSIRGLELAPDATIADAVHTTELARFRDWLTHYLDATRVNAILSEVAAELTAIERAIWRALRKYRDKLRSIENGANAGSMLGDLEAARTAFSTRWSGILREAELAEVIARYRSILAALLRDQGARLRTEVARIRSDIGHRARWSETTVTRVVDRLRPAFDAALRTVETAHEDAMKVVMERLRAIADPMALDLIGQVPLLLGPLRAVTVEGSFLLSFEHPDPGVVAFLEIFSDARRVDRILDAYQAMAASVSAAASAMPMQHFAANVQHAAAAFATAFEARIAELKALVTTPDPRQVAESRQVFTDMGKHLGELSSRLHELDQLFAKHRGVRKPKRVSQH
jgi:hypothetical protein